MRGRRRGAQSGGGVGGVGGARGHNNRLEAGDGAGDGGDGVAGVFDFAVPQRAAARPSHPATLVRRPFGGHRKAALRGRFLHFSILPRRAFRRGKAANDWRKMRLVNPQNGSNMKKTIFTFFVACNLAMSGFFAVLATSPALAAECPLCEAAITNFAEVRRLLDDGADPNQVGAKGNTALMFAAIAGHSQIVKALLDGGANPNQANTDGHTALIAAVVAGHSQIVKILLAGGANRNQVGAKDTTALMFAAIAGHSQIVKALLDGGANPNQANTDGHTALIAAVVAGHSQIVKILLAGGANRNQANTDGRTALIQAALAGHSQIVKALLDGGANRNQADANGNTALISAASKGHTQIVKALLAGGANPNQADANGFTALMAASMRWQVDVVKILSDTSDSSWFFASCITDEMTDDKTCIAFSHPVSFSATNAAKVSYLRNCTTQFDMVVVAFNPPESYDTNTQNIRSLSFLVWDDNKRPVQMQFSTPTLFQSKSVRFNDSAEAVALIKRANNVRIRFPFRRGSKVIKFPMKGSTAAIEKAREGCKK